MAVQVIAQQQATHVRFPLEAYAFRVVQRLYPQENSLPITSTAWMVEGFGRE
jgi:hypothetical protein